MNRHVTNEEDTTTRPSSIGDIAKMELTQLRARMEVERQDLMKEYIERQNERLDIETFEECDKII